jgi:single-stranded-DNA-specific exonuclease
LGGSDRVALNGLHGSSFIDNRFNVSMVKQEPVAIVSDYDCDGVSSAALLARWYMNEAKIKPAVIFPDRMTDGYGLSETVADRIPAGVRKVWVLDCGTHNLDVVRSIEAKGADVTVVDHHLFDGELPDNVWNPGNSEGLCTAHLVYRMLYGKTVNKRIHLAALATLTDVCSMTHIQNWTLVREAMRLPMAHAGLKHLVANETFTENMAGFNIGPVINAAGRIADPMSAFRLLVNPAKVDTGLVTELLETNERRKEMTGKFVELAKESLEHAAFQTCAVVVIEHCHPGIVGIVASRLGRHPPSPHHCPVLPSGPVRRVRPVEVRDPPPPGPVQMLPPPHPVRWPCRGCRVGHAPREP